METDIGWPEGGHIPICAQVVAIADCYDASRRTAMYKAIAPSQAFSMILNGECGKFSRGF